MNILTRVGAAIWNTPVPNPKVDGDLRHHEESKSETVPGIFVDASPILVHTITNGYIIRDLDGQCTYAADAKAIGEVIIANRARDKVAVQQELFHKETVFGTNPPGPLLQQDTVSPTGTHTIGEHR